MSRREDKLSQNGNSEYPRCVLATAQPRYMSCSAKGMIQPYQILFPIGALYAMWGVLIWLMHFAGLVAYPGIAHSHLMIGGFLFSFALGFLMTAVPRFTSSMRARPWEIGLAAVLSLASFIEPLQSGASLATLVYLALFFASRFSKRTSTPPLHFIFIPIGILLGIGGALLMLRDSSGFASGRVLLFQGTMLCFVLGVGGKLVGSLLGWQSAPLVRISGGGPRAVHAWAPAVLLLGGFAFEFLSYPVEGRSLRAAAATWVALQAWKLHRRPLSRGRLVNWLWVSSWGLVSGLWAHALAPSLGVHALHLVFISGFGLMTLMIASRVTLAHGGHGLELELDSGAIRWAGVLITLAALTRASAPLTGSYQRHLAYAASVWIAAMIVWLSVFLPRMVFNSGHPGQQQH